MNLEQYDPYHIFDEWQDNDYEEQTIMDKPVINAHTELTGCHRTGGIYGTTIREINGVLGLTPNIDDDPDKVTASWGFEMDGHVCNIWDYKGSLAVNQVSTYGNHEVFRRLFGNKYFKN